jgi:hypothetical protein
LLAVTPMPAQSAATATVIVTPPDQWDNMPRSRTCRLSNRSVSTLGRERLRAHVGTGRAPSATGSRANVPTRLGRARGARAYGRGHDAGIRSR